MQRQWLVTLRNLPAAGRSWDIDVPRVLLQDKSFGSVNALENLNGDMRWKVSLVHEGEVYRLYGEWSGQMPRSCSRCNVVFDWSFSGFTERDFQLGQRPHDAESDDACEYLALPGELNLVDLLREDVWLAWMADVVCSDSCQGLCQGCGSDLNKDSCKCKQDDSNHPFAALRSLKLGG